MHTSIEDVYRENSVRAKSRNTNRVRRGVNYGIIADVFNARFIMRDVVNAFSVSYAADYTKNIECSHVGKAGDTR
jgi:hypothetical protein